MQTIFPRSLSAGLAVAALALVSAAPAQPSQKAPPPFVTRGIPGPGQAAMKPLVGDWRVKMSLFAAMGTPEKPVVSTAIRTHRAYVAGGRFLADETKGMFGGQPYYRRGTLGYSNMDQRYEWVTQDGLNSMMMIYQGAPRSGPHFPAVLYGSFTDQGLLGEAYVGKTMRQRTVIDILDNDHHRMEIYFTPPGGKERLIDRKEFTRIR
jgi:hypothetical protein